MDLHDLNGKNHCKQSIFNGVGWTEGPASPRVSSLSLVAVGSPHLFNNWAGRPNCSAWNAS
jgi:hypothetical protein